MLLAAPELLVGAAQRSAADRELVPAADEKDEEAGKDTARQDPAPMGAAAGDQRPD